MTHLHRFCSFIIRPFSPSPSLFNYCPSPPLLTLSNVQDRHHGNWPDLTNQTPAFMFAIVETWFSSLPSTCIPQTGKTPTRTALAIASSIRAMVHTVAPPPALVQPLQLLLAICISGAREVGKTDRIKAVAQAAIENFRNGGIVLAQLDVELAGCFSDAFEFLFPTEQ
jgi:hypothetical protein